MMSLRHYTHCSAATHALASCKQLQLIKSVFHQQRRAALYIMREGDTKVLGVLLLTRPGLHAVDSHHSVGNKRLKMKMVYLWVVRIKEGNKWGNTLLCPDLAFDDDIFVRKVCDSICSPSDYGGARIGGAMEGDIALKQCYKAWQCTSIGNCMLVLLLDCKKPQDEARLFLHFFSTAATLPLSAKGPADRSLGAQLEKSAGSFGTLAGWVRACQQAIQLCNKNDKTV